MSPDLSVVRSLLQDWNSGRDPVEIPTRLAAVVGIEDLVRVAWQFPADHRCIDRLHLIDRVGALLETSISSAQRRLIEWRCGRRAPEERRQAVLALLEAPDNRPLDRILALHELAVIAASTDRDGPYWEGRLVRAARQFGDRWGLGLARCLHIERLLSGNQVDKAARSLDRVSSQLSQSPFEPLFRAQLRWFRARILDRRDDPEALWALFALLRDPTTPDDIVVRVARRTAEILESRGHHASAIAARRRELAAVFQPAEGLGELAVRTTIARNHFLIGDDAGALDEVRSLRPLIERPCTESAWSVTCHALQSLILARRAMLTPARASLDQAHRLARSIGGVGGEVRAAVVLADGAIAMAESRAHEAALVASEALEDMGLTGGVLAARVALIRCQALAAIDERHPVLTCGIEDAILRCAQAGDTEGLCEAHHLKTLALVAAKAKAGELAAVVRETARFRGAILDAIEADRSILRECFERAQVVGLHDLLNRRAFDHAGRVSSRSQETKRALVERIEALEVDAASLEAERRRWTRIMADLPVISWTAHGSQQGFHSLNLEGSVESIFGRRPEEFRRDPALWLEAVLPIDRELLLGTLGKAEQDLDGRRIEFGIRKPGGEIRRVEMHAMAILGESPEQGAIFGIMTDVTERKRLYDEVLRIDKMETIGRVAEGVAHQFSNVFGSLMGAASILAASPAIGDKERESVELIERLAHQGDELIARIRSLTPRGGAVPAAIELGPVVSEAAVMGRSLFGAELDIDLKTCTAPLHARIAPSSLLQALLELIRNAVEAGPEDGRVVLSLEENEGRRAKISVVDRGTGMGAECAHKAREPFYSTKSAHRGLGLTTVDRIARETGGELEIVSTPGAGTTVAIELPLQSPPPLPESTPEEALPDLRLGGRLLLADDDDSIRKVIEQLLRGAGFDVVTARDGREALDVFDSSVSPWALLVIDVRMPGRDGLSVARAVRKREQTLPILLMTGHTDEEPRQFVEGLSQIELIRKPFTTAAILAAARRLLSRVRERRVADGQEITR